MAGFRYPYDIRVTLEGWRDKLGEHYEEVVAKLFDRDKSLENALSDADPVAKVIAWAAQASAPIPSGWLLCDGQAVSRSQFSALFNTIGVTYGAGDGSTTFNVPNGKGRVPYGQDTAQTEFLTIGQTGGNKAVVVGAVPAHTHGLNNHSHSGLTDFTSPTHTHQGGAHNHGGGTGIHGHNITGQVATGAGHTHSGSTNQYSGEPNGGGFFSGNSINTNSVGVGNTLEAPFTDGGTSINHRHLVFGDSGNTDSGSGGASAGGNLPPYIVMRYLIRA